jgi:hypothetical protein
MESVNCAVLQVPAAERIGARLSLSPNPDARKDSASSHYPTPVPLSTPPILGGTRVIQGYRGQNDVAPNGKFLIIVPVDEGTGSSMTVVLNWDASLKK